MFSVAMAPEMEPTGGPFLRGFAVVSAWTIGRFLLPSLSRWPARRAIESRFGRAWPRVRRREEEHERRSGEVERLSHLAGHAVGPAERGAEEGRRKEGAGQAHREGAQRDPRIEPGAVSRRETPDPDLHREGRRRDPDDIDAQTACEHRSHEAVDAPPEEPRPRAVRRQVQAAPQPSGADQRGCSGIKAHLCSPYVGFRRVSWTQERASSPPRPRRRTRSRLGADEGRRKKRLSNRGETATTAERVDQPGQHLAEARVEAGVERQVVRARWAVVDDGDGLGIGHRAAHEAKARVDRQRRADHQQRLGALEQRQAAASVAAATVPPKKTTSGLSAPPQRRQATTSKAGDPVGVDLGVAVRRVGDRRRQPARVRREQARVHARRAAPGAAGEAADVGQRAVQLDDAAAARRVVQAVDVLGDDADQRGRLARAPPAPGARRSARASENRAHPSVARAQ